jgi:superfamily II DNA or RNA helicase
MKTPYPQQAAHIDVLTNIISRHKAALDSSKTGTGKTLCAAEVAKRLGLNVFVVAPKATLVNWSRVLKEQGAGVVGVINYEKLRTGKSGFGDWKKGSFIFNVPPKTLIVFDEVHACKGHYTQNAKMLIAAKPLPTLMLSATACENPVEMRALGFLLGLHNLKDFYGWATRFGAKANAWGALEFVKNHFSDGHLDRLHRLTYPNHGHMLTREDLAEFFPNGQLIYDPISFGSSKEIKALLDECSEELESIIEKEVEERVTLKGNPAEAMVKLTRARQKVELLKMPEISQMVQDRLDEGKSVVVFLNFNQSVRALSDRLEMVGITAGKIWGEEPRAAKRQEAIDAFQHDEVHVLICNIAAGGTGVNLHHTETAARPREALISPCYNAKIMEQVFGRIDRAGAKSDPINRVLVAEGSVEEKVLEAVQIKIDNMTRLHKKSYITTMPRTPTYPAPTKEVAIEVDATVIETPTVEVAPVTEIPKVKRERKPKKVEEAVAPTPVEATPEPVVAPVPVAEVATGEDAVKKSGERGHAEFSPSQLDSLSICPGYKGGSSSATAMKAAEQGTRCHAACETGDITGLTEEERMLVEMAMGYESDVAEGSIDIKREICVEVFDQWGFLDTLIIKPDGKADIVDFKFGYMPVRDAEKNIQMKAYTYGVWVMFPSLKEITVHLVQPKLDTISFHTWDRDRDMERIGWEIKLVIERAKLARMNFFDEDVEALFTPLCEACDFCGNRARCRPLARKIIKISSKYDPIFEVLDNPVLRPGEIRDPKTMGLLLRAAKIAAKWAEDTQSMALEQALTEGIVPEDFRLVEVNKPRRVTNALLAYEALKDKIAWEDMLACATGVSIGKLEEIFTESAPRGEKAKYKTQLSDRLQDAGALVSEGVYHKLDPIRTK